MTRRALFAAAAIMCLGAGHARATPSTNFWAPSTAALQPPGAIRVTYDTYFSSAAAYPVTVGLTFGAAPARRLQLEAGFDLTYPTRSGDDPLELPLLLHAKIGAPEGAYGDGSPGWSAGIFGAGFEPDATDYHVLYAMVGRTFARIGTLSAGAYHGLNADLLRSARGAERATGLMAGWASPAYRVPVIHAMAFTWDLQTGENALGATGGGAYFYLTPSVSLLTGPVFFFEETLQPGGARWMWSLQLDADIGFGPP